jgi:hypothetical protein
MTGKTVTIQASDLNTYLPEKNTLICCAGFEERSLTVSCNIDTERIEKTMVFVSQNAPESVLNNRLAIIEKRFLNKTDVISTSYRNPILAANMIAKAVQAASDTRLKNLIIDITTFTHEMLLVLLRVVYDAREKFNNIICLYAGADRYSVGQSPSQVWLSKGCRDVRNVIGYPGQLRPSAKTCLIVLAGFEFERTIRLVEQMEPERLMLGNGMDATSENHRSTIEYFNSKYCEWLKSYPKYEMFEFSSKDIASTTLVIKKILAENPDDNYILVPLNTKLSTLAASMVALENRKIQLCYTIPELYNRDSYSSPGNSITVVDAKSFSVFSGALLTVL